VNEARRVERRAVAPLPELAPRLAKLPRAREPWALDSGGFSELSLHGEWTITVIATWLLIPTMFTLHYADMFYSVGPKERPLKFPDTREPVFWDFAYFSFTIAAACQTADVSTAQGTIRKLVIAHSVLSFFFNVSVLGFAINVTSGFMFLVTFPEQYVYNPAFQLKVLCLMLAGLNVMLFYLDELESIEVVK